MPEQRTSSGHPDTVRPTGPGRPSRVRGDIRRDYGPGTYDGVVADFPPGQNDGASPDQDPCADPGSTREHGQRTEHHMVGDLAVVPHDGVGVHEDVATE